MSLIAQKYINGLKRNAYSGTPFRFVLSVGDNDIVTLPLLYGFTYDCLVVWGDGNTSIVKAYYSINATHNYIYSGTYEVEIYGVCECFSVNNGAIKTKIIKLLEWGLSFKKIDFYGCINLKANDVIDVLNTDNLHSYGIVNLFRGCNSITTINLLNDWDVSTLYSLANLFTGATLFNQYIGSWDVSKVTSFSELFYNTSFNQDISNWDVSSAISFNRTFQNTPFNQDIGGWNVSNATSLFAMFHSTPFNQDIGSWDVSKVVNMQSTFLQASSFNQDIGSWNVNNVTNLNRTFYACPFDQDISGWDISKVTIMQLFNGAFSTTNYDLMLNAWSLLTLKNNVLFQINASYTIAVSETSRSNIIANFNWTINDNGGI